MICFHHEFHLFVGNTVLILLVANDFKIEAICQKAKEMIICEIICI